MSEYYYIVTVDDYGREWLQRRTDSRHIAVQFVRHQNDMARAYGGCSSWKQASEQAAKIAAALPEEYWDDRGYFLQDFAVTDDGRLVTPRY